jgi:hypothetical protein
MKTILSCGLAAGVFGMLPIAAAQPVATDSPQSARTLRYDSAFADYKPWQDLRPIEWRKVNDAVREAASQGGGHAGHGSASAPATAASGSASSAKPATTQPEPAHSGHGHHGGTK